MSKTIQAYVFHSGAAGNEYYQLLPTRPRVTTRMVKSDATGTPTPLYETPDPFIFNFCLYGVEKRFGRSIPLGSYAPVTITFGDTVLADG